MITGAKKCFDEMDEETILEECQSMQRRLSAWEISEANRVFGHRLDYSRVKVHECSIVD